MDNPSEQKYLSSKDAGAILGYTHDYISRLCRQGKMSGIQKGREWFVLPQELEAFKGRHELELQEKKKELSKKFSKIRKEAEARKREARNQSKQDTSFVQNYTKATKDSDFKKVKFKMPKQLVATCVLAFCVAIPALASSIDTNNIISSFTNTVEEGIQDMIYVQATVVKPSASFFSFTPHLMQGYVEFYKTAGELPEETYDSLKSIGEAYLLLYVLQGEALYTSIQNLNTMGAVVLRGYELIGESFWFGSKDILQLYSQIFNLDKKLETSSTNLQSYAAQVSGGARYASDAITQNIVDQDTSAFAQTIQKIKTNIILNIEAMKYTFGNISHTMGAYVGSLFEFNLLEKEDRIRAIRLEK
jgi:hypothetical protein